MAHAKASAFFQNICFVNVGVLVHYEFRFHESCIHSVSAVSEACQYETPATFSLNSLQSRWEYGSNPLTVIFTIQVVA
jgi:hypothetical protein